MAALDGMRVLDMTQYEAGTSCTQMLAWLGADVVKLEPPRGDAGRGVTHDPNVFSQYFLNYNSNKRSIVVDLKSQAGRDVVLKLVPKFDVFVENYGPGVVEDLGLSYDVMKALNPGIIYGRVKGFGLSGPHSSYLCYDWVAQASAGSFSITGEVDGPPVVVGPTIGDSGAGMQMALAITAAFVQKQRTGEGQFIEVSMQESVTMFMRTAGLRTWGESAAPRTGNRRGAATTSTYLCAPGGPNDYVFIMATTTAMWDALAAAMERLDWLTDPRYETGMARVLHSDALAEEIAAWTIQRTKHEAMTTLACGGVPCSAVLDTYEMLTDAHLVERGFINKVAHPIAGEVTLMGSPIRMSLSNVPLQGAPVLGAHTAEVLTHDLGLSADEVRALQESGAVVDRG